MGARRTRAVGMLDARLAKRLNKNQAVGDFICSGRQARYDLGRAFGPGSSTPARSKQKLGTHDCEGSDGERVQSGAGWVAWRRLLHRSLGAPNLVRSVPR